jgi:hypothetical protein
MVLGLLFIESPINFLSTRNDLLMSLKENNALFLTLRIMGFTFGLIGKLFLMIENFTGLLVKS